MDKELTVEKMEKQFTELAQKIYRQGERRITPTFPWVLIRLVPKEQMLGSLVIPDASGSNQQNKPLHEGIVLTTWNSHWGPKVVKEGVIQESVWRVSEFMQGDRILFPSFAGLPVNFLDERHYRLVREWTYDPNGGVMCKVHYDGDNKYRGQLDVMFNDLQSVTLSGR